MEVSGLFFRLRPTNHKFEFPKRKVDHCSQDHIKGDCICNPNAPQHMINIDIAQIVELMKRFPTLQK